jgi:MraZ protein
LLFVGTYEHTIDAKQRLAIPADVRQQLEAAGQRALYCVLIEGPTLALYTESGFAKRADELDHSERPADEVLLYERMFYSNAARIELDAQGRVRIPERLLATASLDREVVLIGVKDHLELHDRQTWNQHTKDLLAQRPDLLMNPRKAMKRTD